MLAQLGGYYSRRIITQAEVIAALYGSGEQGTLYDPSDLSTLFQERTGASATTPAGADDPVGTVLDVSGNGHHRTASSDAARPLLRTDGTRWWLEHDGVDDFMTTPANDIFRAKSAGMVACAVEAQTDGHFIEGTTGGGSARILLRRVSGNLQLGGRRSDGDGYQSVSVAMGAGALVAVGVLDWANSSAYLRRNGVDVINTTSFQTAGITSDTAGLLRTGSAAGFLFLTGKGYASIAVDTVPANIQLIEQWLAQKAGVNF